MSDKEIINLCVRLKRCEARRAEWGNEAKAIKDILGTELDARATDELSAGNVRIVRSRYVREQIDATKLREERPEVYKLYCVPRDVVTLKVT